MGLTLKHKNGQVATISIPLMSFLIVYVQRLLATFNNIFNGYNSLISFYHHIKEYNNNVSLIAEYSPKKRDINKEVKKEDFSCLEIFDIEYSYSDKNKVISDMSLSLHFNKNLLIKGILEQAKQPL